MPRQAPVRAVIDSNIVFEGLTRSGGPAGLVVEAWLAGLYRGCVSTSLAYEYSQVLSTKLRRDRWQVVRPVLGAMLRQARFVTIHYRWRPISPDPGDDHVIDCAINAGAPIVTANQRDFRSAEEHLGLPIMTAAGFLDLLATELRRDEQWAD